MPQTPRTPIPITLASPLPIHQFQKIIKPRRKHSRDLTRVQSRNQVGLRIRIDPRSRVKRVQQRDARPHYQLGFGQVGRHLAEVLD